MSMCVMNSSVFLLQNSCKTYLWTFALLFVGFKGPLIFDCLSSKTAHLERLTPIHNLRVICIRVKFFSLFFNVSIYIFFSFYNCSVNYSLFSHFHIHSKMNTKIILEPLNSVICNSFSVMNISYFT